MDRDWEDFEIHHRETLDFLKETVGRNRDVKILAGEDSEES